MTSASSTTNMKKERSASLLGFTLKQYWTSVLLFTIILFFVIPVPVMMTVSDHFMHSHNITSLRNSLAINWVDGIRYAIVPIMSVLAVVIPCARFSYLKSKIAIDFYHSLPIKRQNLFFTQLGVGALALFIPYVLNILITLVYITTNGLITSALLLNLALLTLEMVVYAIFFYSLSTLVGMVCGLTAVQLVLTAVAIFILPVAQLVAVGFADIFSENMWTDFYLNEFFMEKLSPALRFLLNEIPLNLTESLIMIGLSALMLGLALFLYLKRKSERAGQSVVFTPFGEVVKYILMFIGTLLGGVLFNSIMNDGFWTIFGMVCGMVLVFMLSNTILHKTAKAMFRGIKGLIIFGIAAVITLILLMTNAFGINSHIPSLAMTSRVVVDFDNTMELTLRDKANIEAVHRIYTEGRKVDIPSDKYDIYSITDSEDFRLEVAFYNILGIPTAKRTAIYNKSDFISEFQTILNSEEFREQYSAPIKETLGMNNIRSHINFYQFYVNKYGRVWNSDYYHGYAHNSDKDAIMFERLAEQMENVNFDYFQQPVLGNLNFYSNHISYRDYGSYNLHTPAEEALIGYISSDVMPYSYDEHITRLSEAIGYIEIYETDPDFDRVDPVKITDKEQIKEILYAASMIGSRYSNLPFTFVDKEYYGIFQLDITQPLSNDCLNMSENQLKEHINTYYSGDKNVLHVNEISYEIVFRLGQTPAFIPGLFGK